MIKRLLFLGFLLVLCNTTRLWSQYVNISGRVYDVTAKRPLEAVAVLSTSGRGTITDSAGNYNITVLKKDSLWFSMIGKNTMKYPVDTIQNTTSFDVMIHVKAADLPEVKVRNRYYRLDSIQNRQDYAKVFNFRKPGIRLSSNQNYTPGGVTVGLDLTELINMFRFKRNRQILALQRRLLQQEHDKYIDHRFTKLFVRKITGIKEPAKLDSFMQTYRPEYEFLLTLNDLELGLYIEACYEAYKNNLPSPFKGLGRKPEDEDE